MRLGNTVVARNARGFLNVWKFVHDRSGLSFAEDRLEYLRQRIARRMRDLGLQDYEDYLQQLTFSHQDREFLKLMAELTVNETSFFREPRELEALQGSIVPKLLATRSPGEPIRLWSAGCSTGEEPYSVAMLLRELYRTAGAFKFEIVANDISKDALAAAERGRYAPARVRCLERRYLEQYFVRSDDQYEVTRMIRSYVTFQFGNLMDDHLPATVGPVDVILCRNVMIYFSQGVRRQVLRRLYSTLRQGGYLIVGHNESLHGLSEQFEPLYDNGALIYQKVVPEPID